MQSPQKIKTPPQILETTPEFILKTETVDFNGDNKLDFIVLFQKQDKWRSPYGIREFEWWYTSSFEVVKKIQKSNVRFDYRWFINLDNDFEPEIVSARGYSDGMTYAFYDQNPINWSEKIILSFNPILLDASNKSKEYYWGYPWDLTNIISRIDKGMIQIRCSLDHDIIRDSENYVPKWQKTLPVIFFTGKTTKPSVKVAPIRKVQWLTLQEIIEKVRR